MISKESLNRFKGSSIVSLGVISAIFCLDLDVAHAHNGVDHGDGYELPDIDSPTPAAVYPKSDFSKDLQIRKSATDLTSQEKAAFVNALDTLKNTYRDGSEIDVYSEFVGLHVGVMGFMTGGNGPSAGVNAAHTLPAFLPWHREYVRRFERALQSVEPTVTIPYWDWTDPNAIDVIFQDDFLGPNGKGVKIEVPGFGVYEGGEVKSSPFADWILNEDIHIEPINQYSLGSKLLRFIGVPPFDRYPLSQEKLDDLANTDNYEIFRALLEGDKSLDGEGHIVEDWELHNYAHGIIGGALVTDPHLTPFPSNQTQILGTMNSILSSPYDPIFWLNHSNVDRLWAEWQDNGHTGVDFFPDDSARVPFGHNISDPMWPWDGGLSNPDNIGSGNILALLPEFSPDDVVKPSDVLDFRSLGYAYDTQMPTSVPEPAATFGLIGLAALMVNSKLMRSRIKA